MGKNGSLVDKNPALRGIRTHKGTLQTAVNWFSRSDGRTVVIVGVEHVGEPDYYTTLRKIVDTEAGAGAQVRVERILDRDDPDAPRTEDERVGMAALREQLANRFDMFTELGLGWIAQNDSPMAGDPQWIDSDVCAIDLVRLRGPQEFTKMTQLTAPQQLAATIRHQKARGKKLTLRMMRYALVSKAVSRGDLAAKGKMHRGWWDQVVMYSWRECTEMTKILAGSHDHIVAIWGAPHMRAMSQALLLNGFELTDSEWFTAMRPVKFWSPLPL